MYYIMTKTKCNKIKNNKTLKITQNKKQLFAQKIIKEWKKQTNGCVKMDSTTMFKFDYYLQLRNLDDYDNHIHLFFFFARRRKYIFFSLFFFNIKVFNFFFNFFNIFLSL